MDCRTRRPADTGLLMRKSHGGEERLGRLLRGTTPALVRPCADELQVSGSVEERLARFSRQLVLTRARAILR